MRERLNTLINLARVNLIGILSVLLIFTSIMNIYFYHTLSGIKKDPQKVVREETQRMLAKIAKLLVLPEDEQPTIAVVSDPELLKDQPFFAKAEKGFKVLIYANAGKSILYNPTKNVVVEVSSVNTGSNPQ